MTEESVTVRGGRYADSVTLMQVSRAVAASPGVSSALVAMATDLNLQLLGELGFRAPPSSDPNNLLIAIRAAAQDELTAATELAERLLDEPARRPSGPAAELPHRTMSAATAANGPGLALISVPGQHAFTEAMDALQAGCDVLVFSDNVGVAEEIALKDAAAERGLLVMGPDCGTAVVGGIGLGFSHTLDRGPVGMVAASGTGAQQVLCLLDAAGVGVSAALGVGGRDLSEAVAGRSTLSALRMLDADPATELIVLVSKPPADAVAGRVREQAGTLDTPVVFALLGEGQPDLTAATEQVLAQLGRPVPSWPQWLSEPRQGRPGALRGLFCGGTLCEEAMLIASQTLGEIQSNVPLKKNQTLPASLRADGHLMIDFGDDALTRGRPHPMIDPGLRESHLSELLADPGTAVVLLDVVLGHGAHPDPAAGLLPLIEASPVPVVISLIGAAHDQQDLAATAERLHAAGASVFVSNAAAARHAVSLVERVSAAAGQVSHATEGVNL